MREIYVSAANFARGKAIRSRLFRTFRGASSCHDAALPFAFAVRDSSPVSRVRGPLRRYARLVGAPNCAPSLCSVAGLLLALALQSAYEDPSPSSPTKIQECSGAKRRVNGAQISPMPRKRAERSSAARHELAAQPPARTDFGPQAFGATN
jgi:hypothetical protein